MSDAPRPTRTYVVLAHLGLLGVAALIAWTTVGRDPGAAASGAVAQLLGPVPVAGLADAVAEPLLPAPPPLTVRRGSDVLPVDPPEPIPAARGNDGFDHAMAGIPKAGMPWPPELPAADPHDTPYRDHGGVYGTPGAARIVYLVDASGSLVDTLPFVLEELQRGLRTLRPEQSYAVILFSGGVSGGVTEAPPLGMTRAGDAAITHTTQWLDPAAGRVVASGRPTPGPALRRALAYRPDAVVLLSDGLVPAGPRALADRARLLSLVDLADTAGVTFHTLQLRTPDPLAGPSRRGTLEALALQSGGVHRYISEADLLPPR
ncbi:MAG: hypothetical protein AAF710_06365 [Planctomycetota bacterium]